MDVVRITEAGIDRVLNGQLGMTFPVDSYTKRLNSEELIAHVRDYRHAESPLRPFQIWSIPPGGYKVITE